MSHDALAEIITLLCTVCMAVIGLLYRDFRMRLVLVESNQKMVLIALYHISTNTPLPEHVKAEIELRFLNGKR